MRQWISSESTRAVSCPFFPVQPNTSPCAPGRRSPFRHSAVWKGTERKVFLISPCVAQRAVPCWPSPTVLLLMLSRLPRPEKVVMATRAPNTTASRRISIQVSLFTAIIPSLSALCVSICFQCDLLGGPK